jgi:hypothetical protein
MLGAIVVGAGGSIAAGVFNQTTADKRYVKNGSVLAAGRTIETKLPLAAGTTFTPVATTSIKAPLPGLVEVTATISADDDIAVGHGKVQYQVKVGSTILNPTDSGAFLLDPVEGTPPTNTTRANGSITGVAKVTVAGTVPITLLAREAGAGSILQGRSISAVFVPAGKFPKGKTTKKKPTGTTNVGP